MARRNTDMSSSPQCSKVFFSLPESISGADSLMVSVQPRVQSHASASVCTFKIPITGSHAIVWTLEILPMAVPGQPELAHAFLSKPCCIMTDGLTGCVTPVFVVQVDMASKPCCIMTDGLTGCVTPVFVVQVDTASKPCCIMTDGLSGCVTPVFVVQVDMASKPCCIMTDSLRGWVTPVFVVQLNTASEPRCIVMDGLRGSITPVFVVQVDTASKPCIMTDGLTGCVTPVFVVQLDTVTQRLIGVLGKAGPGKAADNRMYDANIACRKLAARHPMLILR